ncbi:hypothetical protein [Legionella septentrionalis]|uniref:hypothetical protein n=1 Tax=Legionella septentrionalis TaxID=2498109 RepID=UPI000F8CB6C2|nr:hypothetical protein [Legionella septentrionalis]RUR00294.1 hypothetical protein ELY11_02810 [Legionella septentrionalis]RUR11849.1 hypothetical protein ELY14_00985 [Legionella septentrionalis]
MGFFFPLNSIIENSHSSPHSATIKSSLQTKFNDAFNFWAGSFVETPHYYCNSSYNPEGYPQDSFRPRKASHVGIFDYLTLGLSSLGILFLHHAWDLATRHWLGTIPLAIVAMLNTPRFLFGMIMTIISSPIILAVHAVATICAYKDFQNMLALEGKQNGSTGKTMADFLKLAGNPCVEDLHPEINVENDTIHLSIKSGMNCFSAEVNAADTEQKTRITSFLKFNIFATTEKIERDVQDNPKAAQFLPQ